MSYSAAQLRNARLIVAAVKAHPGLVGDQRQRSLDIAFSVGLVETELLNYANGNNPVSMRIPHDAVGWDHGSVGVFQQQVGGAPNSTANWGTAAQCQDVQTATHNFLRALTRLDWLHMSNGQAAQRVQGSAYPDRYAARDAEAIRLRKSLWSAAPAAPAKPAKPAAKPKPTPASKNYAVKAGDNLSTIAHKYGTTAATLVQWNRAKYPSLASNPNLIQIGMILRVG